MRFAQIVGGRVTNPCDGPDVESALAQSFAPGFYDGRTTTWVEVPADAPANAVLDSSPAGWSLPEPAPVPDPAPPAVTVETLAARVDDLTTLLNKIAAHLGVQ